MKKLFVLSLAILSLTACQMTEEITFKKDGSGIYNFKVDMSSMMKMGKEMEGSKDSLAVKKEPKVQDSVIQFGDLLAEMKDSLKDLSPEEQKAFKHLKKMSLHIQVDESKDKMLMAYVLPFKQVSELENIMNDIKTIESKRGGKSKETGSFDKLMPQSDVKYSFDKHSFSRTTIVKEKDKKQVQDTAKDNNGLDQMMQMFSYKIIYHFPKKIKSVSYKDALLSADGKTLHIDVPMDKISENPKFVDFEVIFE